MSGSQSDSISKVLAEGFRVFRPHPQQKKITEAIGPGRWKTFAFYPTQATMWSGWEGLMKEPKNIMM